MENTNPYTAPLPMCATSASSMKQVLAGRWVRLGAMLLDSLVGALIIRRAGGVTRRARAGSGRRGRRRGPAKPRPSRPWPSERGVLAITWYLVYKNGQTIGKKMLGIKVVRVGRQSRVRVAHLLAAQCRVRILSAIPIVGMVAVIVDYLIIFRASRQTLARPARGHHRRQGMTSTPRQRQPDDSRHARHRAGARDAGRHRARAAAGWPAGPCSGIPHRLSHPRHTAGRRRQR